MYNYNEMLKNNICLNSDLQKEFKKQAKELNIAITNDNFKTFNVWYLQSGWELQF